LSEFFLSKDLLSNVVILLDISKKVSRESGEIRMIDYQTESTDYSQTHRRVYVVHWNRFAPASYRDVHSQ
jgi:hypothetical protein